MTDFARPCNNFGWFCIIVLFDDVEVAIEVEVEVVDDDDDGGGGDDDDDGGGGGDDDDQLLIQAQWQY